MPGYDSAQYDIDVYDSSGSGAASGVFVILPPTFNGVGGAAAGPATGTFVIASPTFNGYGGTVIVVPPPPPSTLHPVPIVEIAFQTNPFVPPIWVDVSAYVESFSINRGRNRELDQMQAGTLQMVLSNLDRRFDPTYTGSPYGNANIRPVKRIRVRAAYSGSIYSLFSGFIESWGMEWHGFADSVAPITASDAFKPLNLAKLNTTFPVQTSDLRINAVLDAVSWTVGSPQWILGDAILGLLGSTTVLGPTGDRSVAPGQSVIAASALADTSALQHMQDVAASEFGLLFIDHDGVLTFVNRNAVATAQRMWATFGEQEYPYVDITLAYDDTDIWNQVRVTASGGVVQIAEDAASKAAYFTRTLTLSTLQNSDAQALSLATLLLSRHKDPSLQITAMTLDGDANPNAIYPHMLGRDLGSQVTVVRRPPYGGSPITQLSSIQGIAVNYSAADGGEWGAQWRLAPVDITSYWILGDPVQGILGTSTRLFF